MGFLDDFTAFLEEYQVIGLAVAFVIGIEVNNLVDTLVEEVIMPIVELLLPAGSWQEATITLFYVKFGIGRLISASINFLIVALLVFIFVKYVLGRDKLKKN